MKRIIAYICSLTLLISLAASNIKGVNAQYTAADLEASVNSALNWIQSNSKPLDNVGAEVSDIAVVALKRAGIEYDYHTYLDGMDAVAEKYDEASNTSDMQRGLMSVMALGGDSTYFGGRNYALDATYYRNLRYFSDYAGALIAINSGNIEVPDDNYRSGLIRNILSFQNADGGFGDVSATAAAIIALSKNNNNDDEYSFTYVDGRGDAATSCGMAIYNAVIYLSRQQSGDGDFYTLTDTAMVSLAMDSIGVSQSDSRFVKKDNTVMDGLLTYQKSDGSFSEDYNEVSPRATAYAACAMVSNARVLQRKAQFFKFDSNDSIRITSVASATSKPSSTARPSSTNRPRTTSRPSATTRPRVTSRPKSTLRPSSSPRATQKVTPAPTKRPDLVGPPQLIGPLPLDADDDTYDELNAQESSGLSKAVPVVAIIVIILAAAAIAILVAMRKKLWIFKDKKSEIYHAKRITKTEEHRKYEKRRKYNERGKYKRR